jgi:hypothetical protein
VTSCARCTHRRAHHQDTSGGCLVAGCDCLGYVDAEVPTRPAFTLPEARALWELTDEAGRCARDGGGLTTLSVPGIRDVLTRCQREGGDPGRVYAYFVATDDAVRRGRVSAPPVELVRPRVGTLEPERPISRRSASPERPR